MALFQVIVPEETTNLITNPSVEVDSTGYSAEGGATFSRSTDFQAFGAYSLAVTAGPGDGVYYSMTLSANTTYTFSVYAKFSDGEEWRVLAYDPVARAVLGQAFATGTGKAQRLSVTFTTNTNTSIELYVLRTVHAIAVDASGNTLVYSNSELDGVAYSAASSIVFYTDAWQCEEKPYVTTYCDGDQDGCYWKGTAHASQSIRDARSRAGGRIYDIGDADLRVTEIHGAGMPPVENILQEVALLPGALHQRIKVKPRVLTITFVAGTTDREKFHAARKALIERIKPDTLD